jgi:hypothetical protein
MGEVPAGPLKGKKIVVAPQDYVTLFEEISEEFMRTIFNLEPGDCLITDESSLHDFTGVGEADMAEIQQKIQEAFEIDASDIETGNLAEIFMRIHRSKYGGPS